MIKLCNCRKQFIRDLLIDSNVGGDLAIHHQLELCTDRTEEIAGIIESDCVCHTEEKPTMADSPQLEKVEIVECKKGLHKIKEGDPRCIYCSYTEKQSQSPCEHEWEQMFWKEFVPNGGENLYREHLLPMWGCISKCGLVTCKNPNK